MNPEKKATLVADRQNGWPLMHTAWGDHDHVSVVIEEHDGRPLIRVLTSVNRPVEVVVHGAKSVS